jgi:hypothetical protein
LVSTFLHCSLRFCLHARLGIGKRPANKCCRLISERTFGEIGLEEPGAREPHAGICEGGAGQPASLPRYFLPQWHRKVSCRIVALAS